MWYNAEFKAFIEWLRKYNSDKPRQEMVSVYGFDIYSLWESLDMISEYLKGQSATKKLGEDVVEKFNKVLECFEPFHEDPSNYARACGFVGYSCEKQIVDMLTKLHKELPTDKTDDSSFGLKMNALSVQNAEHYYRQLVLGKENTWNIRDHAMVDCLKEIMKFHGDRSKAIIFAHNTHIGDASATSMRLEGEINVGELVRKQWPGESYAIGFGSFSGTVVAGRYWDAPWQTMPVPPAPKGTWEEEIAKKSSADRIIFCGEESEFNSTKGHRAIGVVFNPERHRGNFVPTNLKKRYDAFLYIHESKALHPLSVEVEGGGEVPDTYPFGF